MDTDCFKAHWLLYVPFAVTFRKPVFCPYNVFMFLVILTMIISLISIRQLLSVMETWCVFFEIRTELLNII
jgi:hypothetical protein